MKLIETLKTHQYSYFTEGFETEKFDLSEAEIDGNIITFIVSFQTIDRFNLPFLLLDRATQSLGFQACSYLLAQQGQIFRFLFLKRVNWQFLRPIRPHRSVSIEAQYNCAFENSRKAQFSFSGTINGSSAVFEIEIDVFLN
ncbi:hypothetical protein [Brucella oryzae]|uniref:Uncharacterized protein n=1 Tax=Brucella oryzae TaxID=335286 RepID=A0A2S7J118_9HYPH|nr:hypothetical protein [Brucella oryzae]PQA73896.1 hypothetical protein C3731_08745 [Brucella oryzae]